MTAGPSPSARFAQTALAAAVALASLGLTACSPQDGGSDKTTLVAGATAEPQTFDFTVTSDAALPQILLYNVYETLLKVDADGGLQPLLATAWTLADDNVTYTFTLNPAAQFASGTPVDAAAVVASIERLKPASNPVVSAALALVAEASAPDAATVVIKLTRPSNTFLYDMASVAGIVVDPAAGDLAIQPAGSGPYVVASHTAGDSVVLARNTGYWGDAPAFDEVVFRYFADPSAMTFSLQTGEIDLTTNLTSPSSIAQFESDPAFTVYQGATSGEVVLGFNHDRAALQDLRVRQAINYAIDRQGLVDAVWAGYGELIGSMVPPIEPYYEDLSDTYPYDPAKARALLAEAGATGLTLTLRVPADLPYAPPAAQYIESQLEAVGLNIEVEELDFAGRWYPEVFVAGDYDMTIVAHVEQRDIVMFADPTYYWHYDNPEFQALITAADSGTPDEYLADMKAAARLLAEDAAADWLFLLPNLIVAKSDLTGIVVNATSLSFDLTGIRRTAG
jgi:peptide/nickel transport system substrate-binding protein